MFKKLMFYFLPTKLLIEYLSTNPEARKEARKYLFAPVQTEDIPLVHAYTDKHGNNYYTYEDITKIPYTRALACDVAMKYSEMGITKSEFKRIYSAAIEQANAGKFTQAFALLGEIEMRMNWHAEEDSLMELATMYFLMEGEDAKKVDKAMQRKKIALWREDEAARGFFLQSAWTNMVNTTELSQTDIVAYLELKEKHKDLSTFLNSLTNL